MGRDHRVKSRHGSAAPPPVPHSALPGVLLDTATRLPYQCNGLRWGARGLSRLLNPGVARVLHEFLDACFVVHPLHTPNIERANTWQEVMLSRQIRSQRNSPL